MDLNRCQAAPITALGEVAAGTVAEQRARLRSALKFNVHVRDLALQTHLSLLKGGLAEAHADAHGSVALVDEEVAESVCRDAGGTG